MKFEDVKKGDQVTRLIGDVIKITLDVGLVDDEFIYCSSPDGIVSLEEGWKFRRDNGAEVDEYLGWDGIKVTGSFLTK